MKNEDFDLKSLENADDTVIDRLINENMLDENEKDKIFRNSMKKYSEKGQDTVISGVEIYKKSKLRRLLSMASVLLLAAGLCGGTAVMLKRGKTEIEDNSEEITTESTVSEKSAVITSEASSVVLYTTVSSTVKGVAASVKSTETMQAVTTEPNLEIEEDIPDDGADTAVNEEEIFYDDTEKPVDVTTRKVSEPIITVSSERKEKPVITTVVQTVETPQVSEIVFTNSYLYTMINSLDYHEYTCDGIPEYKLTFPNGEVYYLNMSAKWVWIASSNVQYEATLTDEIINWLNTYGYPGLEPFEDLELSRNVQ